MAAEMGLYMYIRHDEVPVFERKRGAVSATHYNHVQIALKRLGGSIRLPLPKLKHLDLIIQKDAWIIVDRVLNDVPIAAWVDFKAMHRKSLHEPIYCMLNIYHAEAERILKRTLEAMELMLGEVLNEGTLESKASPIQFPNMP